MNFSLHLRLLQLGLILILFKTSSAFAFPEMIRHGYVNCTSCHVSSSGGDILNDYGRELSKEVLSTWGKDGEQYFAYNLTKLPEWLKLQGEFREAGVYKNTPTYVSARSVFMQADFIAAVQKAKFTVLASIGYQEVPIPGTRESKGEAVSRNHYAGYSFTDQIALRGGKFLPNYGIQTPDHVIVSRDLLGLGQGQESYNIEASYLSEKFSFFGTGIFGRPDDKTLYKDTGVSARGMYAFTDTIQGALSFYSGSNEFRKRNFFGPSVVFGFTPHLFLLSEVDFVQTTPNNLNSHWGALNYQKLGYEPIQGLIPYISQEWYRDDFGLESTVRTSYGLGVQWFPRPHIELNLAWNIRKIYSESQDFQDFAWLFFHYYL